MWYLVNFLTVRRKNHHRRWKWLSSNCIKAASCYSEKSFFRNRSQQKGLASYSHYKTQPLVIFLNITFLRAKFKAQTLSNLKEFFLTHEAIVDYLSKPHFLHYPTNLDNHAILCLAVDFILNCADDFKTTVSFKDKMPFIIEWKIFHASFWLPASIFLVLGRFHWPCT